MKNPRDFTYDNRTGRPPGPFVRLAARTLRGVAQVQEQVDPYADAWHTANLRSLAESGRRWVVLGDSMSLGIGASRYDAGWVDQLQHRLEPDIRLRIINLAATGACVSDVVDQQILAYNGLPSGSEADLVTVLIGSNDLFGGKSQRKRLGNSFAEMLEIVPAGTVVATLPQPFKAAAHANTYIDQAGKSGRINVVDMRTAGPATWQGKLAQDRFHPNDAGYAAIADAFEPVVRRALESSQG